MEKANTDIRMKMRVCGIPAWKVAEQLGVHESTIVRWLRTPLPIEKERRVVDAIARLTQ